MADSIPAALRQADINIWKCATKAAQLQNVKPIMAYWCEYWTVNQILAKQLHTTDEEILRYTTHLMDKLEQTKAEYANEDAIIDDTAGQAYVEQFAQETLDRAERVVKANRVTQQTATTFDAAATFFHLVNIWGPADAETQQKIKYAKWNAARIVKAIKEGKDPNESNPKQEDLAPPTPEPNDGAVQSQSGDPSNLIPRRATVEEVPDADLRRDAAGVSLPPSPISGGSYRGPSPKPDDELRLPGVPTELGQPAQPASFHSLSQYPSDFQPTPNLPSAPASWTQSQPSPETSPPPTAWSQPPVDPPSASAWPHHQPSPPSNVPPTFSTNLPSTAAVASPPVSPPVDSYYTNMAPTASAPGPARPTITPAESYAPVAAGGPTVDEAAMVEAQKHAKWAISALNFEDVPTAVRELRRALELLGAP